MLPRHVSASRRAHLLIAALGLALCLALSACGSGGGSGDSASSGPVSVEGGVGSASETYVEVPGSSIPAPHGSVKQDDGGRWSYDDPAAGKVTLLYFGYTSCPDICPTTMADLAAALGRLPRGVRDKVVVQFVSTDPHRDTAAQIKRWLGGFDPGFDGGRAPIDAVIKAASAYGINIDRPKVTKGDYEVTHGEQVWVLTPHDGAVGYFRGLAGAKAYQSKLPGLVQKYA